MRLLGADGCPIQSQTRDLEQAIEEAEQNMARVLSESLFRTDPESRASALRESITGERTAKRVMGLGEAIWRMQRDS